MKTNLNRTIIFELVGFSHFEVGSVILEFDVISGGPR